MDFLDKIIASKGPELLGALTGRAGLSTAQAETFLPEAGSSIGRALGARAGDLDLAEPAASSNISALLSAVDVGALASKTGVSTEQGTNALNTILPMILGFLGDQAGDASNLLGLLKGGEGMGDALGALKGLSSRFLK